MAKVVLILEHVPLGAWLRQQPAVTDVVLRTLLYAIGVVIVLLMEKAFESRHEHGGFGPALINVFQHRDVHHVWANTIGVTGALVVYNVVAVVRRHVGGPVLARMFLSPPASAPTDVSANDPHSAQGNPG